MSKDIWLKEMLALSIVFDDNNEGKMAGRIRVWIERAKALRNEITELRVEDIRKAYAIVGLQDALEAAGGEPIALAHTPEDAEDEVKYKLSDEEHNQLEKYFGVAFERL